MPEEQLSLFPELTPKKNPCGSCKGTGLYTFSDGKRTGKCFRCAGKGRQNKDDRSRNAYYDDRNKPGYR